MTNSQSAMPYTNSEMRRNIMTALSVLKPDALEQLIRQTNLFPVNQFQLLAEQLIRRYCSRFVVRLNKWRQFSSKPDDLIYNMIHYHQLWEGFSSDEPWAASQGRTISYFLDNNYNRRRQEMEERF